jgi:hypothetical protein
MNDRKPEQLAELAQRLVDETRPEGPTFNSHAREGVVQEHPYR